jgi:hypothetical protein
MKTEGEKKGKKKALENLDQAKKDSFETPFAIGHHMPGYLHLVAPRQGWECLDSLDLAPSRSFCLSLWPWLLAFGLLLCAKGATGISQAVQRADALVFLRKLHNHSFSPLSFILSSLARMHDRVDIRGGKKTDGGSEGVVKRISYNLFYHKLVVMIYWFAYLSLLYRSNVKLWV